MFYTQAKLPVLLNEEIQPVEKETINKSIHDKDLVRTDSTEQKLDKFFGAAFAKKTVGKIHKKKENLDVSLDEAAFQKHNEEFLKRNEAFENKLLEKSIFAENSEAVNNKNNSQPIKEINVLNDNLISKVTK